MPATVPHGSNAPLPWWLLFFGSKLLLLSAAYRFFSTKLLRRTVMIPVLFWYSIFSVTKVTLPSSVPLYIAYRLLLLGWRALCVRPPGLSLSWWARIPRQQGKIGEQEARGGVERTPRRPGTQPGTQMMFGNEEPLGTQSGTPKTLGSEEPFGNILGSATETGKVAVKEVQANGNEPRWQRRGYRTCGGND